MWAFAATHPNSRIQITANAARHPHNFVGDYFYQESRKEAVDCLQLQERMKRFLQMRQENRPEQADPEIIVVVRDGISEGQFRMVRPYSLLVHRIIPGRRRGAARPQGRL